MSTLLIIILILFLLGAFGTLPIWPHQGFGLGYGPSGVLFMVLIVLVILAIMGKL